jgi:alpha-L-rhamnosidase
MRLGALCLQFQGLNSIVFDPSLKNPAQNRAFAKRKRGIFQFWVKNIFLGYLGRGKTEEKVVLVVKNIWCAQRRRFFEKMSPPILNILIMKMLQHSYAPLLALLFFAGVLSAQNPAPNPDLLDRAWPAKWIAHPEAPARAYGVYHFRKTFTTATQPVQFVINVSGDHRYVLYVNGKIIARGPARSDTQHWNFETLDIAAHLKAGENTLAALVWHAGDNAPFAQLSYQTGFIVQGNGPAEAIANTNASWRVWHNKAYRPEPVDRAALQTYIVTGDGDRIDGGLYPWGWEQPGYDDGKWPEAKAGFFPAKPRGAGSDGNWMLVPRAIPQMASLEQRFAEVRRAENAEAKTGFLTGKTPVLVAANTRARILIDQGHLTNGYPQLTLSKGKNAEIALTYAEALIDEKRNKGHRNDIENKHIIGVKDVFVADGSARRSYGPLWFRTWRYVQIDIATREEELVLEDFISHFTGYPFEEKGAFASDDPALAKIWEVGWRTARMCAQETYVDCPYYEQLQYTGDTRVQAFISLYVSGDDRLMRKALLDYDHSRIPDGLTQSRYPCNDMQVIPTFSLFWVSMIHDYWMHRRDDAFVRAFMPGIRSVLQWHRDRLAPNGLNGRLEWWNFVDWAWDWDDARRIGGVPKGDYEGGSSILSLQQAYTLRQAADLLERFGKFGESVEYDLLASRITAAAKRLCWDAGRGLMADTPDKKDFSQHANIWAVLTDAVPRAEQPALLRKTMTDTSLTQATFYFKFYLFQALKKTGLGDEFLPQLKPWQDMIDIGLSTFAENPEPVRSDCHAWSASPVYEFLSTVCGVNPATPGFKRVRIQPFMGKLKQVEGKMPHPDGMIEVSLRRSGQGGVVGTVVLPEKVSGEFLWGGKRVVLKGGRQEVRAGE